VCPIAREDVSDSNCSCIHLHTSLGVYESVGHILEVAMKVLIVCHRQMGLCRSSAWEHPG
jgi:hypothetical protein